MWIINFTNYIKIHFKLWGGGISKHHLSIHLWKAAVLLIANSVSEWWQYSYVFGYKI